MKKKLLALVLMLAMVLTVGLVACTPETEAEKSFGANQDVYAFSTTQNTSHSGLAFVNIKTNALGQVTTCYLDEAFIPNEWAKITVQDAMLLGATWSGTVLTPGAAVMIANIGSGGSWTAATAPTFYPRYIELTLGGTAQLYRAKLVAITNNSGAETFGEATEGAVTTLTPTASTHADFAGTIFEAGSAGCVRYYPVTAFGQEPATNAISLEQRLSTDNAFAKSYITTLKTYELGTPAANKDTTAIKYVKDASNKINTNRLAARKQNEPQNNTATATTGSIAIGKSSVTATTDLTGANLAYAATFFKRNSTYDSRQKYYDPSTGALVTAIAGTDQWTMVDSSLQFFLNNVVDVKRVVLTGGGEELHDEMLKLEKTSNTWKYNFAGSGETLTSFASSYHVNIYLSLYVKAYLALTQV